MNWFERELEVKARERELRKKVERRRLTAGAEAQDHRLDSGALFKRAVMLAFGPQPSPNPRVFAPVLLAAKDSAKEPPCPSGCQGHAA